MTFSFQEEPVSLLLDRFKMSWNLRVCFMSRRHEKHLTIKMRRVWKGGSKTFLIFSNNRFFYLVSFLFLLYIHIYVGCSVYSPLSFSRVYSGNWNDRHVFLRTFGLQDESNLVYFKVSVLFRRSFPIRVAMKREVHFTFLPQENCYLKKTGFRYFFPDWKIWIFIRYIYICQKSRKCRKFMFILN